MASGNSSISLLVLLYSTCCLSLFTPSLTRGSVFLLLPYVVLTIQRDGFILSAGPTISASPWGCLPSSEPSLSGPVPWPVFSFYILYPPSWLGQCPESRGHEPPLLCSLAKPFPSTFHSLPTPAPPGPSSVPGTMQWEAAGLSFGGKVLGVSLLHSMLIGPLVRGCLRARLVYSSPIVRVCCVTCVIQSVPPVPCLGWKGLYFPAFLTGLRRVPRRDRC